MPVFLVSTRSEPLAAPPRKRPRRLRQEWLTVIYFIIAVPAAGGLFSLLTIFRPHNNDTVFILLPVFIYLAIIQIRNSKLTFPFFAVNLYFKGSPLYLLLTICLAFLYSGLVTGIELLIHRSSSVSPLILITTTLAWALILDPARMYCQTLIEQRYNRHNREALKALEAFTSTLREEIDLDQLRERFLTVIQRVLQPYSVSLWIRTSTRLREHAADADQQVVLADDDPLVVHALRHPGLLEIERLQLDSAVLRNLKGSAAELILPLASQGELLGLLILGPKVKGGAYTHEESSMLNTLAPQVAPALRVTQMVQEQQDQVRERERIEQELRTAQAIQHAFLPRDIPVLPGWQIAPYYHPAREVGGDFYDFLAFADGRLGLVIGDVTGKGIPAALVMATVHTMLRTAVQEITSPGSVLARVNDLLAADIPAGMFVTCFYAILDPSSGGLRYANAGHEPPYRQLGNQASELWATGMPLGMMPGSRYDEHEAALEPGESLLFYSDGLVEAHNAEREMFGFPRLQALLSANSNAAVGIDVLLGELKRFTGDGWEQEDDVTLVTLQRIAMHETQAATSLQR